MKTINSPFFTPRIERPVPPALVNRMQMNLWLKRQKRTNLGYFKDTSVRNKIKMMVKKNQVKNACEKIYLGESYTGHKVYLNKYASKLPKLSFNNGYELDFNHYLNNQAYTAGLDDDSLKDLSLSPCGTYFIISFQYKNSDLEKVLLFDLKSRRFLKLPWDKGFVGDFTFCWTFASELILAYTKPQAYFKKEKGLAVFLYNVGTNQGRRYKKIFSMKKSIPSNIYFEENDHYKGVYIVTEDTYSSTIYYKDLKSNKKAELVKDLSFEKAKVLDILEKTVFYTENSSTKNNGQIASYDIYTGVKTILVPEYPHLVLNKAEIFYEKYLLVSYLDKKLKNEIKIFDLFGKLIYKQKFSMYGDINFWEDDQEKSTVQIELINFEASFNYVIDLNNKRTLKQFKQKTALWGKITTKFGHYPSFDGEKIPYFLLEPKGRKTATMLYAYGSFFDHTLPSGGQSLLSLFLELKGSLMMPCIRGGGERGYYWNRGGAGTNKIKSIRDYLGAAEFLFKKKYATPETLIAHGISGGGLVVAAAVNFQPSYFKAALPFVGLMDMLNYQKYSSSDNWHKEFGKIENMKVYSAIAKYCPVNKVKRQIYPSILAITGSHDVRVAPIHTYKFVDKVQRFNEGENPILLENVKNHGHFAYDEPKALAKTLLFLIKELNLKLVE